MEKGNIRRKNARHRKHDLWLFSSLLEKRVSEGQPILQALKQLDELSWFIFGEKICVELTDILKQVDSREKQMQFCAFLTKKDEIGREKFTKREKIFFRKINEIQDLAKHEISAELLTFQSKMGY